jgi:hypothetical protein
VAESTPVHIVGRLRIVAPAKELRGHAVRAHTGGRVVDCTTTDGAGRFLLTWSSSSAIEETTAVELLNRSGAVVESVGLSPHDLVYPSVVEFSGRGVLGSSPAGPQERSGLAFEADGDYPLCVTSACIEVTLSWRAPARSSVSILSEAGQTIRDGLGSLGSLRVLERETKKYLLRAYGLEGSFETSQERVLEVRRYPSLSLVLEGSRFKTDNTIDLGVSISCPADRGGLGVMILTSDPDLVARTEFTVPAGSTWASTEVRLGRKTGAVEVVATARGYVRDGVTLVVE